MKIVGISACPAGLAHTPMAAKALEKAGKALGYDVKMEQQGSMGQVNEITKEEAEKKIIGLHEAYFEIRGSKGHVSYVAGVDEEAGDVDSMYNLVLQRH